MKKRRSLRPRRRSVQRKVVCNKDDDGSRCRVEIFRHAGSSEILSLWIRLEGELAHFPSTSNSREIGYRWWWDKRTRTRLKKPFIKKSTSQLRRLEAATRLYGQVVGTNSLSFHDREVTVLVLLAEKAGRFDSHNQCKPIGDWLQQIGVIHDDEAAEIFCVKSSDYIPGGSVIEVKIGAESEMKISKNETVICILDRKHAESCMISLITSLLQRSTRSK